MGLAKLVVNLKTLLQSRPTSLTSLSVGCLRLGVRAHDMYALSKVGCKLRVTFFCRIRYTDYMQSVTDYYRYMYIYRHPITVKFNVQYY